MIKQTYTLRDFENITGIEANTLRVWKSRYGILESGETVSGKLRYSSSDLRFIMQVKTLLDTGMKISTILSLGNRERIDRIWAKTLNKTIQPSNRLENSLLEATLELDRTKLNSCYLEILERHPFSEAMSQILLPFLKTCGELWQNQSIHVAQEHFISNFIRQKLIAASDLLIPAHSDIDILLFLPEGEQHELPLLFSNYLILESGQSTLYLGAGIPYSDLKSILVQNTYSKAVTGWIYGGDSVQHANTMREIAASHPDVTFHINCPDGDWETMTKKHSVKLTNLKRFDSSSTLLDSLSQS